MGENVCLELDFFITTNAEQCKYRSDPFPEKIPRILGIEDCDPGAQTFKYNTHVVTAMETNRTRKFIKRQRGTKS